MRTNREAWAGVSALHGCALDGDSVCRRFFRQAVRGTITGIAAMGFRAVTCNLFNTPHFGLPTLAQVRAGSPGQAPRDRFGSHSTHLPDSHDY